MIKGITLDRFKAFREPTRIELAPITLIYGENSAGKTSVLQALNLLKQTLESREREAEAALLPKAEEGLVDLGSFRELIFDHDLSHSLRIGLSIEPSKPDHDDLSASARARQVFAPFEMFLQFGQERPSSDVRLERIEIGYQDRRFPDTEFEIRRAKKNEFGRFAPYLYRPRSARAADRGRGFVAECASISADHESWRELYSEWHGAREEICEAMRRRFRYPTPNVLPASHRLREAGEGEERYAPAVRAGIEFYARDFTIQEFIERVIETQRAQLSFVDGFLLLGSPYTGDGLPEEELPIRRSPRFPSLPSLSFTDRAVMAGRHVADALSQLFPLGPFRRPPERWYMFTGTSPLDVGYQGDHLPDLLLKKRRLVRVANEWLERLGVGYALRVKRIGGTQSDLYAVRLQDTRREEPVEVALSDVGFGISQILPFVVQCLASERQIISIEQPEVHIHPRLQADLGDLIAATVAEAHSHQFLIETHSEHLVLRLQKLIRSGHLRPEDVSVIYVSRGKDGSTATRLHLDDEGDFVDDWPGGFFAERMREFE